MHLPWSQCRQTDDVDFCLSGLDAPDDVDFCLSGLGAPPGEGGVEEKTDWGELGCLLRSESSLSKQVILTIAPISRL